ncbi:MAG: phosphate-starvation-inducible PsiE family protein, partial [Candidatus Binatia bacterium]|nr:phosphate-starvation-inducible PsiE family protein [Candidatus Binatia bacterium]
GLGDVYKRQEFNHTVLYMVRRQESVVQARIVIWIALLALARKFIVLDISTTSPEHMFGLAAITVALGVTLWLSGRGQTAPSSNV